METGWELSDHNLAFENTCFSFLLCCCNKIVTISILEEEGLYLEILWEYWGKSRQEIKTVGAWMQKPKQWPWETVFKALLLLDCTTAILILASHLLRNGGTYLGLGFHINRQWRKFSKEVITGRSDVSNSSTEILSSQALKFSNSSLIHSFCTCAPFSLSLSLSSLSSPFQMVSSLALILGASELPHWKQFLSKPAFTTI